MVISRLMDEVNPQRLITLAFRARPRSEFLVFEGQHLTRRQVLASGEALAAGLLALGVKKGDRVATLLPDCPEAIYALFLPWVLGSVNSENKTSRKGAKAAKTRAWPPLRLGVRFSSFRKGRSCRQLP